MRRVLMTLDAVGGVWRYALDLAQALGERDVRCLLLGFGPAPSAEQRAACEAIPNGSLAWADAPLDWMARDAAALHAVAPTIAAKARAFDADLLHLNLPSQAVGVPDDLPVVAASHSCLSTWFRAVRGSALPASLRWQHSLTALGLRRADAIVAPSKSHAAAMQHAYADLPRIHVVPNASRVAPAVRPDKQDFVFAAGRWWDDAKNARTLDDAAATAAWPVLAAGSLDGPDGSVVAFRNVHALGPLHSEDVLALSRRAAVFASPSCYEPFGLAVLEAALCGAALVLADIPTFRELWDGAAVFLPQDDSAAWAAAFNDLAGAPARRRSLGALAQTCARALSPQRQVDGMLAVYAAAQARRGGDARAVA
jgi:glycosyltransferase involved in cell wall biosynthesis